MKKRLALITIAFCVSFASMVALSLYSMGRFTTFTNYARLVDHTSEVIINIRSAEVSIRDIGLTERGYMITRDTMYLRFLNNSIDSINTAISAIQNLTCDNTEQQKNIRLLKAGIALRIVAARDNIAYVDSSQLSVASKYYDDSRLLMIECVQRLSDMRNAENKLLAQRSEDAKFYQQLTNNTLKSLLIVFCIITLVLFATMIKELRNRMLFQEELEARVIDLKRSHSELEEIAYAASHDLQEPLRKIQIFSDMLLVKEPGSTEEYKDVLERINNSANRMQLLMTDLMNLTNLTKTDEQKKPLALDKVLQSILNEINDKLKEKQASVDLQMLPVINGYEQQLRVLFKAILDNSLKFTREGIRPVINISCDMINGHELSGINPNLLQKKFYRITCSDNGIGFDNQFISKMFKIFQRLHNQESGYIGKGIGLAICQRIMANHEGYILADGTPGMGAKFKLFFPVEE